MAWMYIIYSSSLDRYYVGSTRGSIEERLRKHNSKHKGFTGQADDWTVVYKEDYEDYKLALHREKEIKSWKSRKKIEELIRSVG